MNSSSTGVNCFPEHQRSLEIGGDVYINSKKLEYMVEHTTYHSAFGDWECITYSDNTVDMYATLEISASKIIWHEYQYISNFYECTRDFDYFAEDDFEIQNATINATCSKFGDTSGWIEKVSPLQNNKQFALFLIGRRPSQTETIKINVHVHGTRVDNTDTSVDSN